MQFKKARSPLSSHLILRNSIKICLERILSETIDIEYSTQYIDFWERWIHIRHSPRKFCWNEYGHKLASFCHENYCYFVHGSFESSAFFELHVSDFIYSHISFSGQNNEFSSLLAPFTDFMAFWRHLNEKKLIEAHKIAQLFQDEFHFATHADDQQLNIGKKLTSLC